MTKMSVAFGGGAINNRYHSRCHDDHTIQRKLPDLLPAFDPRPGRLNLPQTVDFAVPAPGLLLPLLLQLTYLLIF